MIKVKIPNPIEDRNEPTFRPLFFVKDKLRDYSIDITDSDDFDYMFVGMNEFIDKQKSLEESVEMGLENLSKISGDYFLFDGSDSTSLMGAYEVFIQSKAIYLLKNQKLFTREEYLKPYAFNKYFFGTGSDLDLSYDIPENVWDRIKFTGFNLGYLLPHYKDFQQINSNKTVDVCAIFKAEHPYCEDHKVRNDVYYTEHRRGLWENLEPLKNKYNMLTERMPFQEYVRNLWNSKICLSPFGMGELCFRDFEAIQFGTIILKPSQSKVDSIPNIMFDDVTYIPCKYDWSDLEEKIDYILTNFDELNEKILTNIRSMFKEKYTYENLCMYYYSLFSELEGVEAE
jgi:hypothetical protein|tara:strand:+ start:7287 stop:8312 length:1026 start_codon:yes stop_codon:yes gene_type:complete